MLFQSVTSETDFRCFSDFRTDTTAVPLPGQHQLVHEVEGELVLGVYHLRPQGIDGKVLTVDDSHKHAKLMRVLDSGAGSRKKPVHCVLAFFNELQQVVLRKALLSAFLSENQGGSQRADHNTLKGRGLSCLRCGTRRVLRRPCVDGRHLSGVQDEGDHFSTEDNAPTSLTTRCCKFLRIYNESVTHAKQGCLFWAGFDTAPTANLFLVETSTRMYHMSMPLLGHNPGG